MKLDLAPGMLDAMRRDLKLTDGEIAERMTTEAAAPVVENRLRKQLGKSYGGAWIPAGSSRLTVGVTSAAGAAEVHTEGADAKIVEHSEKALSPTGSSSTAIGRAPARRFTAGTSIRPATVS